MARTVRLLDIDVDRALVRHWQRWLAPEVQPFFVADSRAWSGINTSTGELTAELRDTYKAWKVDRSLQLVWIREREFARLPRAERAALVRAQVDAGRPALIVR